MAAQNLSQSQLLALALVEYLKTHERPLSPGQRQVKEVFRDPGWAYIHDLPERFRKYELIRLCMAKGWIDVWPRMFDSGDKDDIPDSTQYLLWCSHVDPASGELEVDDTTWTLYIDKALHEATQPSSPRSYLVVGITQKGLDALVETCALQPITAVLQANDEPDAERWYPAQYYGQFNISSDTLRQAAHDGRIRKRKGNGNRNEYPEADVRRCWPHLFPA